ncbi:serine/threonine-protein kinase [Pseudomonas mosselii]|uniref:serine/threonine-protein kinase n=1 Tax=Pseudomonas mosselii TaxID=78327 RepID=UPI0007845C00|nr:serine/threonine-protein kinase [Pseudomonas mosselii]KXG80909.1 hypothetical protein AXZ07_20190 [Pseudomonas mosselii]
MAESPDDIWIDAASYEERWDVLDKKVGEGGQGVGHRAARKSDRKIAFVKVIGGVGHERRTRSYGEVKAYQALEGQSVPRIIETNTHKHDDDAYELYIATEFIDGLTLRKWRDRNKRISPVEAIELTLNLLSIVEEAHAAGILHRDIKPENIMVSSGDGQLVLVDFGIAYNRNITLKKALTSDGHQLGNRFYPLPELFGGSVDKRSCITDLASVSAILFFLLTGRNPSIPQGGDGSLPHQREDVKAFFSGAENSGIRAFFDRALQWNVGRRFQTAQDLRASLVKLKELITNPAPIDDMTQLMNILEDPTFTAHGEHMKRIRDALGWAVACYGSVRTLSTGKLTAQQVFINEGAEPGYVRIRWDYNGVYRTCTHVWVEAIGSELVWHTTKGEVYRASIAAHLDEAHSTEFGKRSVLPDMLRILQNQPNDLPEEFSARLVLRDRLAASTAEAVERSAREGLPVFVIIYDDSPTSADREHLLERILGDEVVQRTILATFILLIVGRSKLPEHIEAPRYGDACAVIELGQWTRIRPLVANRNAAREDILALRDEFEARARS